jgi:hypothetical protein
MGMHINLTVNAVREQSVFCAIDGNACFITGGLDPQDPHSVPFF